MNNQSFQKILNSLSVLSAFFVLASLGCGYSLAGRESYLPETISEIGIPILVNQSTFFDVELILTEKLRAEFIGRGRYRVIPDELGDAILSGEIVSITVNPVGFTDQQLASRYQFALTISVEFTDTQTGEVLWVNDSVTFREEYELATRSNLALEGSSFLDQERSAFDRIATDIARSLATAVLEAF